MDIFMRNINYQVSKQDLQRSVADILHNAPYLSGSAPLLNFDINLFPPRNGRAGKNCGCGVLSLPNVEVGERFLTDFGGDRPSKRVIVAGRAIKVSRNDKEPSPAVLDRIRRQPYLTPEAALQEHTQAVAQSTVAIRAIQFGWETRERVISIEWEKQLPTDSCDLSFEMERRQVWIAIRDPSGSSRFVIIPFSQVHWCTAGNDEDSHPIISLSLLSRPIFHFIPSNDPIASPMASPASPLSPQLTGSGNHDRIMALLVDLFSNVPLHDIDPPKRQRVLSLYPDDEDLDRVLPYTSLVVRLVTQSDADLAKFRRMCKEDQPFRRPDRSVQRSARLGLFSKLNMARYRDWVKAIDWLVAFRIEALLQGLFADLPELFSIRGHIERALSLSGPAHVVSLLQHFERALYSQDVPEQQSFEALFLHCMKSFTLRTSSTLSTSPDDGVFDCLHASVTPTAFSLDGPLPERSNRVMRTYNRNQDSFLRVSFVEENNLQYRHDSDIDDASFVRLWVLRTLRNGLYIGGRHFNFLAYSQSALKSHTVWMVKRFRDPSGDMVTAATIIKRLGTFHDLNFDRQMIYCPARYGARVSQSFTATDSSVSVEAEEIHYVPDIERVSMADKRWCFTDGVGIVSLELAEDIWSKLQKTRKRLSRRAAASPRAFQIRFKGSKGMVSVDHSLSGRVIALRPSMIKFESPDSLDVDIAQAFVRPSPYFLNRPLIMLLEGHGVPFEVFEQLQKSVLREVDEAGQSFTKAAKILDQYGLATSYRVSSTLLELNKIGVRTFPQADFYQKMLQSSTHHIRRDLKQHARIPVRDGYTLVGVADIHYYLEEDQVFACVPEPGTQQYRFLEGPMLISRSPTIHPGDVRKVHAIGTPPVDSPFAKEYLPNTVVFSVKGDRPLPSCLGGGDLDGDVYNVTTFQGLLPPGNNYPPAAYDAAPKKLLARPSTMDDVAEFVADYIVNDVLGIVATNWLLIADQNGIIHPDCLKLAQVHSDAVDYPKSGQPVSIKDIPKPRGRIRPDWYAPETVEDLENNSDYYKSTTALGRLFRGVDLPVFDTSPARKPVQPGLELSFEDIVARVCTEDPNLLRNQLYDALESRVSEFVDIQTEQSAVLAAATTLDIYADELQVICASNSLSRNRTAMLTEEEAVVGTIVARCSQPRRRKDAMARLRDQTDYLVKRIREDLTGEDDSSDIGWLKRSWTAWKVAHICNESFGAKSFGWISLGAVFDATKALEQGRRKRNE